MSWATVWNNRITKIEDVKEKNYIGANTYEELQEQIFIIIEAAQKLGLKTHTTWDASPCEDPKMPKFISISRMITPEYIAQHKALLARCGF